MDFLWSPWRYDYVTGAGEKPHACVFCLTPDRSGDAARLVVFRGTHNFIILNLFPYTSGHLMVVPYVHVSSLDDLSPEEMAEMMALAKRCTQALEQLYQPDGFNLGMNIGHSAGAGVRDHVHLHVVPRWAGDTNFMTIVGETRVLPESLSVTYERLSAIL